ncbi:putative F-box/LRR-repeat protein At4g15060 [Lolium rigidum]|uniref:putative F-box/LRR-repeat protein At4g15060 n=1 Tax=Lolium rigidum TaxID=89674 RepID=UPI001F5DBB13|nr:putative F-box/LRR-repeat protein At4g15060 [Lolium rigidum]
MEVAGRCSRKRKSAELGSPEVGAASEGRGPGPTAGDQVPPPPPLPGAEGGGSDRISDLPDAVLGEIISLLPTKEGARTQVLASRWRRLWRSAPLNLHCTPYLFDRHARDAIISRILAVHQGPGRRFCAPVYHLHGDRAEAWLRSPALDNLQELELCSYTFYLLFPPATPQPLPAAAFRFSDTLRVATIGECHLTDSTVQALLFPKLQKLALNRVSISETSLHTLLAACPALECLLIHDSTGFRCVRINSSSLRSIGVRGFSYQTGLEFPELVIENAPSLKRLLQLGLCYFLHISVISAPKLETLGYLSSGSSSRLVFDSTVIQELRVHSFTTTVRTVKILAVDMKALSLDVVIDLMRCFPSLEKLYLQSDGPGKTNLWRRKHQNLIRSLDIRLKTVVCRHYRGIKSHVDFATFFLLNARVLELMTFEVHDKDYNEAFFAQQREMLQVDSRASRGARLRFTSDWSYRYISLDPSVHDLDPADPFERTQPPIADTNFMLCGNC